MAAPSGSPPTAPRYSCVREPTLVEVGFDNVLCAAVVDEKWHYSPGGPRSAAYVDVFDHGFFTRGLAALGEAESAKAVYVRNMGECVFEWETPGGLRTTMTSAEVCGAFGATLPSHIFLPSELVRVVEWLDAAAVCQGVGPSATFSPAAAWSAAVDDGYVEPAAFLRLKTDSEILHGARCCGLIPRVGSKGKQGPPRTCCDACRTARRALSAVHQRACERARKQVSADFEDVVELNGDADKDARALADGVASLMESDPDNLALHTENTYGAVDLFKESLRRLANPATRAPWSVGFLKVTTLFYTVLGRAKYERMRGLGFLPLPTRTTIDKHLGYRKSLLAPWGECVELARTAAEAFARARGLDVTDVLKVTLATDEVDVAQRAVFAHGSWHGIVDGVDNFAAGSADALVKKVQMFLIRGADFKFPFGMRPVASVSGDLLSRSWSEVALALRRGGFTVRLLTSDSASGCEKGAAGLRATTGVARLSDAAHILKRCWISAVRAGRLYGPNGSVFSMIPLRRLLCESDSDFSHLYTLRHEHVEPETWDKMSVSNALAFFSPRTINCVRLYSSHGDAGGTVSYMQFVRDWWTVMGSRQRITAATWPTIRAEMQRLQTLLDAMIAAAPPGRRCTQCNANGHAKKTCTFEGEPRPAHLSHELLGDLRSSLELFLTGTGTVLIRDALANPKANFCLGRLGQDVVEGLFGIARGSCGQASLTVQALDLSCQRQRELANGAVDARGVSPKNGRQTEAPNRSFWPLSLQQMMPPKPSLEAPPRPSLWEVREDESATEIDVELATQLSSAERDDLHHMVGSVVTKLEKTLRVGRYWKRRQKQRRKKQSDAGRDTTFSRILDVIKGGAPTEHARLSDRLEQRGGYIRINAEAFDTFFVTVAAHLRALGRRPISGTPGKRRRVDTSNAATSSSASPPHMMQVECTACVPPRLAMVALPSGATPGLQLTFTCMLCKHEWQDMAPADAPTLQSEAVQALRAPLAVSVRPREDFVALARSTALTELWERSCEPANEEAEVAADLSTELRLRLLHEIVMTHHGGSLRRAHRHRSRARMEKENKKKARRKKREKVVKAPPEANRKRRREEGGLE